MPLRVVPIDRSAPDPSLVAEAAAVLARGGLVAFPTETVYGLGARALDPAAVARIFAAKGRPAHHPLIAHVLGAAQAAELAASWPEAAARAAAAFWPGPLTLVVDRAAHVPAAVAGGGPSIAVRAPAHPVALALIAALGEPIAAPSANAYQGVSPTLAAHVVRELGDAVDLVLDAGPSDAGIESTVVDVRGGSVRVLRPGPLGLTRLREVLPDAIASAAGAWTVGASQERASPGMGARHYAPRAPLELEPDAESAWARALALAGGGRRVGLVLRGAAAPCPPEARRVAVRRLPDSAAEYARALYRTLHELDDAGVDAIVVEDVPRPPDAGAEPWLGVADRLSRASGSAA